MKNSISFDLERLPDNELVYIDTNIFIYYVTGHSLFSNKCRTFLKRVEDSKVHGVTSLITYVECMHKLIIIDTASQKNIKPWQAVQYIKQHPDILGSSEKTVEIIDKLRSIPNIKKIPLTDDILKLSDKFVTSSFLMTMDAIHASTMMLNGINNIATNDNDFERIEKIKLWKPGGK